MSQGTVLVIGRATRGEDSARAVVQALGDAGWLPSTAGGDRPDAVVTVASGWRGHVRGWRLARRGAAWVAVAVGDPGIRAPGRWRRAFDPRLVALRRALAVVTTDLDVAHRTHSELGLAVSLCAAGDLGRRVVAVLAPAGRGAPAARPRVLMLGTCNTPHVEHLALALRDRGADVVVGGDLTPAYPPSVLPERGVATSVQTLPAHLWLRRLRRRHRPDVVHAHWLYGAAFLAATARARPLVAMAWGSDVYGATGRYERMARYALRHADVAMTDSAALVERLIGLGAARDRTYLLNWGVDLERFSPGDRSAARRALGLPEAPTVLSPRAITPLYNTTVIVEAMRRVREQVPDAQLVLKHLGAEAPPLGPLPDYVRVIGHVAHERMADFYRAADVTVSIPTTDSSPRSVWEAMACGSPVVVSDLPWVAELIEPGRHALVTPIAPAAVADAIVAVLAEPSVASGLAAEGRALVERERNQDREMARLLALYERLVSGPSGLHDDR